MKEKQTYDQLLSKIASLCQEAEEELDRKLASHSNDKG